MVSLYAYGNEVKVESFTTNLWVFSAMSSCHALSLGWMEQNILPLRFLSVLATDATG